MKLKTTFILITVIIISVISNATANEPEILAQFDTVTHNAVLLPVTIAGEEHLFIMDTGATITVFDKSLKKYLGKEKRYMPIFSHDKAAKVKIYDIPESFVGQMKLNCEEVCCMDLTLFSLIYGKKIRGIVGMNFLKHHVIRLDYDQGKVFFFKSNTNSKSELGQEFNLEFISGYPYFKIPCIDITLFDDIKVKFKIDTGKNGSISLNRDDFKRLISKEQMNKTTSLYGTISGLLESDSVRCKNFSIEPLGEQDVIIDSNPLHNLIGMRYLSRYLVTFDFPNSKVYLKKGKNFNKVDEDDMSGLHLLLISDNVVVHSIDPGSPSIEAGIQTDDIILKVNGKGANTYGMWKLRDLLMSGDKKEITMAIKRKDEIKEVSFLLRRKI